jgi:pyruvyl transferase EpsO
MSSLKIQRERWKVILDGLKGMHEDIYKEIGCGKVAYLDLPVHFNVGDLLIHRGTENFFKEYGVNVVYRESKTKWLFKYRQISKADVILFHGGGNFGDLYPDFQRYREKIVKRFPDKKIIVLPQSVYFEDSKNIETSSEIFREHPDIVFYVRDAESIEVARRFSDNVKMMPDMAHSMHPIKIPLEVGMGNDVVRTARILNLERLDKESPKIGGLSLNKQPFDWRDLIDQSENLIMNLCKLCFKFSFLNRFACGIYLKLTGRTLFKAISYVDGFDIVRTDRLHGYILSVLLGKSVFVVDNSYGKCGRYKSAWLEDYPFYGRKEDLDC